MVRATCSACAWSVGGRALARRPRVMMMMMMMMMMVTRRNKRGRVLSLGVREGVCSSLGVLCAWNACGQLARFWWRVRRPNVPVATRTISTSPGSYWDEKYVLKSSR